MRVAETLRTKHTGSCDSVQSVVGACSYPRVALRPPVGSLAGQVGVARQLTAARCICSLFVGEDSRGGPADTLGVADSVDFDNLALDHSEGHHEKRSSADGDDYACHPVDQRRSQHCGPADVLTEATTECLPGNGHCPSDQERGGGTPRASVSSQDNVGIEQSYEGVEVAGARCFEEGVDHLSLASEISVRSRYLRTLDTSSRPAGELSCCCGRSSDHGGDLIEGQLEHVVEHEGQPLVGGEGIEDNEQGETDRIGQQRLLRRGPDDRIG